MKTLLLSMMAACVACSVPVLAADPYPAPDAYKREHANPQYMRDALDWLGRNPQSNDAPRAAMDLVMSATIIGDEVLRDGLRARILLAYAASGPAAYLMTQFKDVDEFAAFVLKMVERNNLVPSEQFSTRALSLLGRGGHRFGTEAVVLEESALGILAAVWSVEENDPKAAQQIVRLLEIKFKDDPQLLQIVRIAMDPKTPASEKFVLLNPVESAVAKTVQGHFHLRVAEADRANPPVLKTLAQWELDAGKHAEAMKLLDAHPGKDTDPQIMYWRVWLHGAAGEANKADAVAAAMKEKHPNEGWTKSAGLLAEAARESAARTGAYAETLLAAIGTLRTTEQIELSIAVIPKEPGSDRLGIYFAFASGKLFELHISRAGKPVLAYRTTPTECAIYSAGDGVAYHFAESGMIPAAKFALTRDAAGVVNFNAGFDMVRDFARAGGGFAKLLENPLFANKEGVAELLRSPNRFLGAVEEKDGGKAYWWMSPSSGSPELTGLRYTLAADGRIIAVASGAARTERIAYGPAGSFELKPPPWPAADMVRRDKFDGTVMFKLMGSVMQLFTKTMEPGKAPVL